MKFSFATALLLAGTTAATPNAILQRSATSNHHELPDKLSNGPPIATPTGQFLWGGAALYGGDYDKLSATFNVPEILKPGSGQLLVGITGNFGNCSIEADHSAEFEVIGGLNWTKSGSITTYTPFMKFYDYPTEAPELPDDFLISAGDILTFNVTIPNSTISFVRMGNHQTGVFYGGSQIPKTTTDCGTVPFTSVANLNISLAYDYETRNFQSAFADFGNITFTSISASNSTGNYGVDVATITNMTETDSQGKDLLNMACTPSTTSSDLTCTWVDPTAATNAVLGRSTTAGHENSLILSLQSRMAQRNSYV